MSDRLRITVLLPEGRAPAALRAWLISLSDDRRIEICAARIVPASRAKAPLAQRMLEAAAGHLSTPQAAIRECLRACCDVKTGGATALPQVDVLVDLTGGPLPSEVTDCARLGVLSLDPPPYTASHAIRAVLARSAGTSFCVRLLQPGNLPEKTLVQGSFRTQVSLLRNCTEFVERSLHYLRHAIGLLADGRPPASFDDSQVRLPVPAVSALSIFKASLISLGDYARKPWRLPIGSEMIWQTGLVSRNWQQAGFTIERVLHPATDSFVADPFLVRRAGRTYCFVEEYDTRRGKGHIAVYDVTEVPKRLGIALADQHHLSFPFLFSHDSELYMVPECAKASQIRLYRCREFPAEWELSQVLMDDVSAADTMIFPHDGLWWMFTNINPLGHGDHCSELYAFHADKPESDSWTPHARNPLIIDPACARNGGLIKDGNSIYRVAQEQRFGLYGAACSLRRIVRLDPETFEEEVTRTVEPAVHGLTRLHHVSSIDEITAFDFMRCPGS